MNLQIKSKIISLSIMIAIGMIFFSGTVARVEAASIDVTINDISFPDANFRSYVTSAFDTNRNGILSTTEQQAVTSMDMSSRNIGSLTGIEIFSSLKTLTCINNSLTSIELSKNLELEYLDCDSNQLTSLDITKNTKLKTLICYSNRLTKLDISKNTMLESVNCSSNRLMTLSTINNVKLQNLNCASNQIIGLDLETNTKLLSVICYNNQLSNIDTSKNVLLSTLTCYDNNITSLDVTKNTILNNLNVTNNELSKLEVSLNTALLTLDCSNNNLAELNVSQNTLLSLLYCSNNNLRSLDISKNVNLRILNSYSNRLTSLDTTANVNLSVFNNETNKRTAYVNDEGVVDTTSFANFNVAKTSNWVNAVVSGSAITVSNVVVLPTPLTYIYDEGNGHSGTYTLIPVKEKQILMDMDQAELYLSADSTHQSTYAVNAEVLGGTTALTWSTSNASVATVDLSGIVTPVGCGQVTITACSQGYASASCKITVYKDMTNTVVDEILPQIYTGTEIKPAITITDNGITLLAGIDYNVSYSNNVKAGVANVMLSGIGKYQFQSIVYFKINYNINYMVADVIPAQTFTGTSLLPALKLRNGENVLKEGTDYTLAYVNNKDVGTGVITITGKGDYTGTKIVSFEIYVPQVQNLIKTGNKTNQITLTWNKVDNMTGYRVYRYDAKTKKYVRLVTLTGSNTSYVNIGLTAGTDYKYRVRAFVTVNGKKYYGKYTTILKTATKTGKPTLKVNAGSKKATITWNKISTATGYRLYMSKTKTGKFARIKIITSKNTAKYTKKSLVKGKTYYFKIRSYKTVAGKNIYSSYSSIKSIKIK